ncbi:MAG: iron ABC transporter permease [Desulfurococcales archaeon]|nr:iron ABC transporter permease [Desulfurococcales archaeon]
MAGDGSGSWPRYSPRHLLLTGLIAAVLYYLFVEVAGVGEGEYIAWLLAVLLPVLMYYRGLNVDRMKHSFGLSFLLMIGYIYTILVLLLRIPGIPRAVALLLFPLVVAHATSYLAGLRGVRGARAGVRVPFRKRVRSTLFKLDTIIIAFLVIGSLILVVFLVVPVLLMLLNAFVTPPGTPFYENFVRIFTGRAYVKLESLGDTVWSWQVRGGTRVLVVDGVNYGILLNSLINSTIVTSVATLLGIIVAFVLARYSFPGRTLVRLLAIVPLFVTPFINSYVIKLLFGTTGPISWATLHLFGFAIEIRDLAGVTIAQIMAFYPIVYLNAYSAFLSIDPSMEEQAENLGSRGLRLFTSVTLPLALPGIAAGSIIVFIFSLEDLGAPIVFQERRLMSYQIYSSFTSQTGIVSPEIAALGFVMLFLAVASFLAIRNYISMRSYAMISRGGRWQRRERRLGAKGLAAVYLLLLPLIIWTAMPQIGVILLAFNVMPPTQFSLNPGEASAKYFLELFTNPNIFIYIRNTLAYALTAVAIAVTLSIIVGYAVSRAKIRVITPTLDSLATIPIAIPGLVVALGYFYFFSDFFKNTPVDPTIGPTLFQAWIVLIIAYSIRKLPFVVRSVFAGFQQVHEGLEEAALNLGASRRKTIFGIVLPLIFTYIISGAIIGFIYISTEVSTSVTIGSLRPDQAPMTYYMKNIYIGGQLAGIQYVAAMGVLLILFQLLAILVIIVGLKQSYAFIGA